MFRCAIWKRAGLGACGASIALSGWIAQRDFSIKGVESHEFCRFVSRSFTFACVRGIRVAERWARRGGLEWCKTRGEIVLAVAWLGIGRCVPLLVALMAAVKKMAVACRGWGCCCGWSPGHSFRLTDVTVIQGLCLHSRRNSANVMSKERSLAVVACPPAAWRGRVR